jgi:ABC-2 type transport system permease protein
MDKNAAGERTVPKWAIETFGLSKRFPGKEGWRGLISRQSELRPAVDNVSLQVCQGELFGLLGPNGAGKTTLIKMLSTLIEPTGGTAHVNGFDLADETAIKRSIGLVTSDERSFYWRLSGRQNLEFFSHLHGISPKDIPARVKTVLDQVDMLASAEKSFQTYSTGMRQRISIARALLNRPQLLFLDEPTRGLDPGATHHLHELIQEQLVERDGITVFLTTHDLEEAEKLCERIAIMNHGRILACGTVSELRSALEVGVHYSIRTAKLHPKTIASLAEHITEIQTETVSGPGEEETLIEFRSDSNDEKLDKTIDILKHETNKILSITQDKTSLEAIFAEIVERENEHRALIAKRPKQTPIAQASHQRIELQLGILLKVMPAFLKRDLISEASYRFSFILQIVGIFFNVAVFYFIAQLLGQSAAPYLAAYGGDYFSFVLIGIAFAGYFNVGLSSFSSRLRQSQTTGTLEAMLATPTSLSAIILSSSLWDYLLTTTRVLVYLVIGGLFMGVNLGRGNYGTALLVLLLTITSFSSLGIIAASFIMVLKRGDPVTWLFNVVSGLLGGVYFPVAIMPGWMQWLSKLLPITYALEAMRLALLQGATPQELIPEILALGAFSAVLLPLSLFAFRYAVRLAKVDGSLTHY